MEQFYHGGKTGKTALTIPLQGDKMTRFRPSVKEDNAA
jgi:hypothetical protein